MNHRKNHHSRIFLVCVILSPQSKDIIDWWAIQISSLVFYFMKRITKSLCQFSVSTHFNPATVAKAKATNLSIKTATTKWKTSFVKAWRTGTSQQIWPCWPYIIHMGSLANVYAICSCLSVTIYFDVTGMVLCSNIQIICGYVKGYANGIYSKTCTTIMQTGWQQKVSMDYWPTALWNAQKSPANQILKKKRGN